MLIVSGMDSELTFHFGVIKSSVPGMVEEKLVVAAATRSVGLAEDAFTQTDNDQVRDKQAADVVESSCRGKGDATSRAAAHGAMAKLLSECSLVRGFLLLCMLQQLSFNFAV